MTAPTTTRPSSTRGIPVRRLRTDPVPTVDGWLVPDDPIFSHFLATLSAVFPRGEDFFVTSVRRHRDAAADDPVLRRQVNAFIGQEAMHGRAHRALNRELADRGYHTVRADRGIGAVTEWILRAKPHRLAIAATAAAEHYTGLFAETVLDHDATRTTLFGDPGVQPLITWHALEELEHKNVAFDVMVASGGGYPVRAAGFAVTSGALGGYVAFEWARAIWGDRTRITAANHRRFRANLMRQRLLSPWFLRKAFAYLRPGFHPDDTDTDHIVDAWRLRLADDTIATGGAA